jgi:hypothetical protein
MVDRASGSCPLRAPTCHVKMTRVEYEDGILMFAGSNFPRVPYHCCDAGATWSDAPCVYREMRHAYVTNCHDWLRKCLCTKLAAAFGWRSRLGITRMEALQRNFTAIVHMSAQMYESGVTTSHDLYDCKRTPCELLVMTCAEPPRPFTSTTGGVSAGKSLGWHA